MTGTDPNTREPSARPTGPAGTAHPDTAPLTVPSADAAADTTHRGAREKPRRIRWSVAGLAVAGLMVAGGIGGVVADSVSTGTPPSAASSPANSIGSSEEESAADGFSAQTVADPATLAETLDHVHEGITVPDSGSSSGDSGGGRGSGLDSGIGGERSESPDGYSFGGPDASFGGAQGAAGTQVDAGVEVQDAPGVLLVETETSFGEGAGTGMVLSADGLALTNYHVVDGSSEVEVTVADTGETYTASVVGRDATHDVAVLQLQDASGLDTISVDSSGVDSGEGVAAVGNGSGQGYLTAVSGTVTGVDQSISAESLGDTEDLTGLIETDADVVPGYSGGPLVDEDGQVVGMSTAASTGQTSEQVNGFAIGITEALGIADQIVAGTESDSVQVGASGALGITVTDAAAAAQQEYADPRSRGSRDGGTDSAASGALVVEVAPGSAAESAGLVAGDTVTALDGTEVADSSELSDQVSSLDPGDSVSLVWTDADGAEHTATVDLGESTVN
ncbi:hypothetical protein GCM10010977_09060 [Citricoccus zhacaiensis]|uniref:PDZ domain-containing protein n=1 Tax=Citricoccus zhacaiensis TaxID=489142 RepID=A0ABQ2LSW5_9MICC|nr:trypsin-like peptidase domain-containing protein [Citricoccus zhacaiensis]GGO42675.1 hypothetical protein GCM10010977_09060 [Citricoccus zhacaiensis]